MALPLPLDAPITTTTQPSILVRLCNGHLFLRLIKRPFLIVQELLFAHAVT
jgi:hypothetical protein